MTKQAQAAKNIKLSTKVAEYISKNPDSVKDFDGNLSFVVFSEKDSQLNEVNADLVEKLKQEGKNVIKVQQTSSKKSPWKFISL